MSRKTKNNMLPYPGSSASPTAQQIQSLVNQVEEAGIRNVTDLDAKTIQDIRDGKIIVGDPKGDMNLQREYLDHLQTLR
ncbi:hypothetical protein Selin_1449 [Desulfurispirillum indicum S5]|uniref:Uncharacterized protein n=1 Tax=Desulfurispirillum indicum (strain ATCC BAA-1389 / DSM 22839 / S5) TaxID=653733 RepID=E6W6U0_DESIS|nr:hypothetical protein [Desulfurispirillum indicum]ADU66183.1 hypothetical protein Selin_1449 [Desulfurispirillum indicum S5]